MRKLSRDARHERRVQVIRLRKAGRTYDEIAQQTGLSRTGVFDICNRYEAAGGKAPRDAHCGRTTGDDRLLDAAQETAVRKLITDKTPDQLKMPYALWTRPAMSRLIEQRFGIRLPARTMGLYLARWGFTPQKPMKKAYEQSPAAVKKWLDEDYPVITARAKAEGVEIHWGDGSGLRSDDVRGRGFAPKGQMRWRIFDGALNANILIDFLRRLIKAAKKKVFLILDNLRVRHAKPVKAWLAEHAQEIELFYLPGYSPELNPDEMANADIKQAVTKLAPARTKLQLVKATARHLRSVQRQPERIRKYFEHGPVRYAA